MFIRLEENVPQNYIDDSRDFQLFCRLYNCINNGVRFDIESMIYLFDPLRVNNKVLELLATRVGFFPKRHLNDMMMRYIIASFPYIIKYKGSKRGIKEAIATVLKADNISANYNVSVYNKEKDYIIEISIDKEYDRIALKEILDYISPIGYLTKLSIANNVNFTTELDNINIIYTYLDSSANASKVSSSKDNWELPTYKIEEEIVTKAGETSRITTENEDKSVTTVYTYYEVQGADIIKKTMTVNIPHNDDERYISTIERSEVVGFVNDIDSDIHSDFVFNDVGEQNDNIIEVFNLKDNTLSLVEGRGEVIKLVTYKGKQYIRVQLNYIEVIKGSNIISSDNTEGKNASYIQDAYGKLARVEYIDDTYVYTTIIDLEGENDE